MSCADDPRLDSMLAFRGLKRMKDGCSYSIHSLLTGERVGHNRFVFTYEYVVYENFFSLKDGGGNWDISKELLAHLKSWYGEHP